MNKKQMDLAVVRLTSAATVYVPSDMAEELARNMVTAFADKSVLNVTPNDVGSAGQRIADHRGGKCSFWSSQLGAAMGEAWRQLCVEWKLPPD